jgi:hypothetical protein
MMEALHFSGTSLLTRATQREIAEEAILHCYHRENLKSYRALTGRALQRRSNVALVKYELGLYISDDLILHSPRDENIESYRLLTS